MDLTEPCADTLVPRLFLPADSAQPGAFTGFSGSARSKRRSVQPLEVGSTYEPRVELRGPLTSRFFR